MSVLQNLHPTNIGPGVQVASGVGAFVTTGATLAVPCPFRTVLFAIAMPIGTPASDENFSFNASLSGNSIAVTPGGSLTLTRTGASKTSALAVAWLIVGR